VLEVSLISFGSDEGGRDGLLFPVQDVGQVRREIYKYGLDTLPWMIFFSPHHNHQVLFSTLFQDTYPNTRFFATQTTINMPSTTTSTKVPQTSTNLNGYCVVM